MQDRPNIAEPSLYDTDFYAWCHEQARLLRAGQLGALEIENVAEELETLGRALKQEVQSRAQILNTLLLRWRHQPELRGRAWSATILSQRHAISSLIEECPSLRDAAREAVVTTYADALADAELEAGALGFPAAPPFTPEQALDRDFLLTDLDRAS